jgi:hypothetical protein
MMKNLVKLHQVQEFDESQKPTKWAQSLTTGPYTVKAFIFLGSEPLTLRPLLFCFFLLCFSCPLTILVTSILLSLGVPDDEIIPLINALRTDGWQSYKAVAKVI